MLDNPAVFLAGARQKARHIHERQDRNLERVTETHEPRCLARRVDVEAPGQNHRLVRDDTHGLTLQPNEPRDDVLREILLDFKEIRLVPDLEDQLFHVIWLVRIFRHQRIERRFHSTRIVKERTNRWLGAVIERQEIDKAAHLCQRFDIVLERTVGHRRFLGMGPGTPKLFGRYLFVRNRLHDIRPGDEHVGAVLHHENEVCHRRAIDRATGARAHDHADLRDDARGHDVALKDLGVTSEAVDTFLNARAAGIVKAYDRSSVLHRHIEDLADLLGVRLGH